MACPPVVGTAALKASSTRPALTLLEGGASRVTARRTSSGALTQRQMLAISALCVALVCVLGLFSLISDGLSRAAVESAIASAPVETITVHDGDTLWGIAQDRCPEGVSASELVTWISQNNELSSGLIYSGQRLVVPVASLE